jgi:hypothetical protein
VSTSWVEDMMHEAVLWDQTNTTDSQTNNSRGMVRILTRLKCVTDPGRTDVQAES